jgi:hypothetical protein
VLSPVNRPAPNHLKLLYLDAFKINKLTLTWLNLFKGFVLIELWTLFGYIKVLDIIDQPKLNSQQTTLMCNLELTSGIRKKLLIWHSKS